MRRYIGTKMVMAAPALRLDDGKGNVRIELLKNNPMPSPGDAVDMGYKVIYEDGYESWSPLDVFENAYRKVAGMNFGLAIEAMKMGLAVARKGWNGKGIYLQLQEPDENSKMTLPYSTSSPTDWLLTIPTHPRAWFPGWQARRTCWRMTGMLRRTVMGLFKRLFHRHTWKPLKVAYRYREGGWGRQISVKRCQCTVCGRIEYIHFDGKNMI